MQVGGRGVLLRAHRLRSALRRIPVDQYDGFFILKGGMVVSTGLVQVVMPLGGTAGLSAGRSLADGA